MRKHEELRVWQDAMTLVEMVYRHTNAMPEGERFGLTAQMRRAAVSVPSNIAEGAARGSDADFVRFLHMARGSLSELDTQLQLAARLGFIERAESAKEQIQLLFGQLGGLIRHLKTKQAK